MAILGWIFAGLFVFFLMISGTGQGPEAEDGKPNFLAWLVIIAIACFTIGGLKYL